MPLAKAMPVAPVPDIPQCEIIVILPLGDLAKGNGELTMFSFQPSTRSLYDRQVDPGETALAVTGIVRVDAASSQDISRRLSVACTDSTSREHNPGVMTLSVPGTCLGYEATDTILHQNSGPKHDLGEMPSYHIACSLPALESPQYKFSR